MIKNLEQHIKQWTDENAPIGHNLGYPECCIKEFCEQPPVLMRHSEPTKNDQKRYKAGCVNGKFSGFIPCKEHAKQILMCKIKLHDLIDVKKRDPNLPVFPLV